MIAGNIVDAIGLVSQPSVLFLILVGVLIGVIMGSIPGMTATMTVAVLVSFTFTMQPIEGMGLLLGIYGGALYAGSIPAILIRTPGTPSAAATIFDGFPMANQGEAGKAIGIATIASFVGGLVSVLALVVLAPQIAEFAINFGSPEFFALALFGLTIIANVGGDSLIKGLISGFLGILIALVGLDPILGYPRYTFDIPALMEGVEFIPVMIGLFGIAEGLRRYTEGIGKNEIEQSFSNLLPSFGELRQMTPTLIGSSVVGVLIGSIPGAGGDIASFVTYNETKRRVKNPVPEFGDGNILGLAAAESGNNSSTGGALIPTLTLGIPGDAVGAILIGALLVHGLRPGPELFQDEPALVYGIFITFFLVYVAILIVGLLGAHVWVRFISLPEKYLWPVILILCFVGAFALRSNLIDVWFMLGAGLIGYLLSEANFPLVPLVLGMILGPIAESNVRRSLTISGGSYDIFISNTLTLVILVLTALSLLRPLLQKWLESRRSGT